MRLIHKRTIHLDSRPGPSVTVTIKVDGEAKAYRVRRCEERAVWHKLGTDELYRVVLRGDTVLTCNCEAAKYGKRCKHLDATKFMIVHDWLKRGVQSDTMLDVQSPEAKS